MSAYLGALEKPAVFYRAANESSDGGGGKWRTSSECNTYTTDNYLHRAYECAPYMNFHTVAAGDPNQASVGKPLILYRVISGTTTE